MINKLTKEQIELFPKYIKEGIKIGLSTETDKKMSEEAIKRVYKCGGLKEPDNIHWVRSPYEAQVLANKLLKTKNTFYDFCYGQTDISWIIYYKFMKDQVGVTNLESIEGLYEYSKYGGWFIAFNTDVILSEKPIRYSRTTDTGLLDSKNGYFIEYSDGYKIAVLDRILVTDKNDIKEYVEKEANDINVKGILNIENVDLRRAVLNKVGPANLLKNLNANHLDSVEVDVPVGDLLEGLVKTGMYDKEDRKDLIKHFNSIKQVRLYDLYEIDFGEFKGKYLRMVNPSIESEHIEGVSNECLTVEDALRFRDNKSKDDPAYSVILS